MNAKEARKILEDLDQVIDYISVFSNHHGESYVFYYTPPTKFTGSPGTDSITARILGAETSYEWVEISDTIVEMWSSRGAQYPVDYKVLKSDGELWVLNTSEALWLKACFKACRIRHDFLAHKARQERVQERIE